MKRLTILLLAILCIGCQKKIDPDRTIYGTWYCVVERDLKDKQPHFIELVINENIASVTTHHIEYNDYWNSGGGTYSYNNGIITFNLTIDIPPPFDWWEHATRKFIQGKLMTEAYFPTLKIEIESIIGEEIEIETFWFRRENPYLEWIKK